jgi:hypothetical protein
MKALWRFGRLKFEDYPDPAPGPGEVRVAAMSRGATCSRGGNARPRDLTGVGRRWRRR